MVKPRLSVIAAIGMVLATAGWSGQDVSVTPQLESRSGHDTTSLQSRSTEHTTVQAQQPPPAQFDHVMVDPANPGFIIPCVKVLRRLYKKAAHHPDIQLLLLLRYSSNGQDQLKVVLLPLRDMELTHHHPQPNNRKLRLVETMVDVTDAPIDPGSNVIGTAHIIQGTPASGGDTFAVRPFAWDASEFAWGSSQMQLRQGT